jgi:hypothetical protein
MPTGDLDPADVLTAPISSGHPISSARQYTTALAPRGSGWDFICQSYRSGEDVPTEWIVVNLDDGEIDRTEGANGVYSNTNFQIPSSNTLITENNQLRAPGGRIFFPEAYGHIGVDLTDQHYVNVAYYEPSDRRVHQLPSFGSPAYPSPTRHAAVYSAAFDHVGDYLYLGTQAVIGDLPFVFRIDPESLAMLPIGPVGAAASVNPKYAYYVAKDAGPGSQWLYVAVGQDPWELVAINVTSGAQTILATTTGPGFQFVTFDAMANGWRTTIYNNGTPTLYWLADGAITAYPGSGSPPGGARAVTPYTNPLDEPPEIDWSHGIGEVSWRPFGSSGGWTPITYDVRYTGPVAIESLAVLADASLLGNGEQYSGFFRQPAEATSEWFGAWPLGLSSPVLLPVSESLVYLAGYPNGAFYAYDPRAKWQPGAASPNPSPLGSWNASTSVKYSYYLERCETNARIYQSGRRERDSSGSGIGYYVPTTATFTGVTAAPLDNLIPRGMVVIDSISRLVFSGETLDASDASLLVYDLDLAPIAQHPVQAGLKNTGQLYETSTAAIVCAVTNDAPYYVYRFNVITGELIRIETLSGAVWSSTQRPHDRSVWIAAGSDLVRMDPDTLARTTIASLSTIGVVMLMAWTANTLWLVNDAGELYSMQARTLGSGHADPTP